MAVRYLTEAEFRARWGSKVDRLLDRNSDGMPDAGLLTLCIERGEREADGILRQGRYTTAELPTTPSEASLTLKDIVSGMAWYFLHEHFDIISEAVKETRTDARALAWNVQRSQMNLGLSGDPSSDRSAPVIHLTKLSSSAELTLEKLEDW